MDAPQSPDEIEPIELAIRREIDDLLRIRWNPQSYVTRPGAYDAYGLPIGPQHEGRWEVVRPLDGRDAVIYQVRYDGEGGEAYRAVGWWLLDFLRKWDRANRFYIDEMKRMYADEDALVAARDAADEEATREHWEERSFHLAGNGNRESWFNRGFGTLTARERRADVAVDASSTSVSVL